ncbi:astacin [Ancylostoma ceylanicum]|uniref:Metalloendopeptidase n=1 Tax=Ancylostoma ceylanicum TaxID=53326 RepID=A0A0D6MA17_9BILA|nr:astacin [Ancylostoma ceylanicum]
MRTIPTILLAVVYLSGAVLGGIRETGTRSRRSHDKHLQRRGSGTTGSKVIYYYFDKRIKWEAIKVEQLGGWDCAYTRIPRGPQYLSVDCGYFGGIAHEVGHALGLVHTQSRYDRDKYISVVWPNVEKEFNARYQDWIEKSPSEARKYLETFKKEYGTTLTSESDHYGVPYDYGSIMHYGTSDEDPPMIPTDLNHNRTMGSQFISFTDLLEINERHKCTVSCAPQKRKCENDGFFNPKKCDTCVCPSGYGGRFCENQPDDGGEDLKADATLQTIKLTIQSDRNASDHYVKHTTWIRTASKTGIEVEIENISDGLKAYGCAKAGVEIKTQDDQKLTGYRFRDSMSSLSYFYQGSAPKKTRVFCSSQTEPPSP